MTAVMICIAPPVGAQEPTSRNCDPGIVRSYSAANVDQGWARFLPDSLVAAHAALIASGDFPAVARALASDARVMGSLGNVTPAQATRMARRFEELATALSALALVDESAQPRILAQTVKASDFQLNQVGQNFPVFPGTPLEIMVTPAMSQSAQRALCWPTIAADIVLTELGAPWRARTVEKLTALAKRWDTFIADGYSQFPWELALNSALRSATDYEPPRRQFILLHPSLSAEVHGAALDQLSPTSVLSLEALGALVYNAEHSRYAGASLVTTTASGVNASAGIYFHMWFPQMTAGYVWRKDRAGKTAGAAVLSVDLYKFVTKSASDVKSVRDGALAGKLSSLITTP